MFSKPVAPLALLGLAYTSDAFVVEVVGLRGVSTAALPTEAQSFSPLPTSVASSTPTSTATLGISAVALGAAAAIAGRSRRARAPRGARGPAAESATAVAKVTFKDLAAAPAGSAASSSASLASAAVTLEEVGPSGPIPFLVPFVKKPRYWKYFKNYPGDAGFDPLDFAGNPGNMVNFREAELKHARLAMLAAVGWPLAELYHPSFAKEWNEPSLLADLGRAPSVLNGGLIDNAKIASFMILFLAIATVFDLSKQLYHRSVGDLGFDPLSLQETTPPGLAALMPEGRKWMQEAELKNGRLAMVAITSYAIQEFALKTAVVNQTPFFFHGPF